MADLQAVTIWTCSRYGIGIIDCKDIRKGFSYYQEIGDTEKYKLENVTDLCTNGRGNIWIQTVNKRLCHINTRKNRFGRTQIIPDGVISNRIKSIFSDDGKLFWLTLAPSGVALFNRATGRVDINAQIRAFASLPYDVLNTHNSSMASPAKGELWFANNGHGIVIVKNGKAEVKNQSNCPYVKDNYVKALLYSRRGIMFIGERHHLNYRLPSGQCFTVGKDLDVCSISEDHNGSIWVATENAGIIRMEGDFSHPRNINYTYFNPQNGNYPVNDAIYCKEDSRHRMWSISNSGGLFLLENGKFNCFNDELHWGIDRIFSILEDSRQRLWLTTDNALVCLTYRGNEQTHYSFYTRENGLGRKQPGGTGAWH